MRLLILGGTVFLGRHLVAAALAAGHEVTLFNRGRSQPDLFDGVAGVSAIRGDRDGGLDALGTGRWEAVVDTCGYLPRIVGASARALASRVEHYTFISTISVYADFSPPGPHEGSALVQLANESIEKVDGDSYGGLKVLCEQAVNSALPGRNLLIRPGLIVGPQDPTDRFSYWPLRAARGGDILAPGNPDSPVQFIDVRDLCAWTIRLVAAGATGVFNATGPAAPLTLGGLIDGCIAASGVAARPVWVEESFLLERELAPFSELPCWVPGGMSGLQTTDISGALAAGLAFRPLAETIADTRAWREPLQAERPLKAGLSADREAQLLAEWGAAGRD